MSEHVRIPHDSSLVQATQYDPHTKTLHVELLHKGTYSYGNVPEEDVQALRAAPSIGAHFNSVFKPAHGHKGVKTG